MELQEMYDSAAAMCLDAGVAPDSAPCGAVHRWVVQNVSYRPGTEFFIVLGITSALLDILARREGYANAIDKAVKQIGSCKP